MNIPSNLKSDNKKTLSAFAEIAEKAKLADAFRGLSQLDSDEIDRQVSTSLNGIAEPEQQEKISTFLKTGVQAVKLLDKLKGQAQPDDEDIASLSEAFDKLSEAGETTLRDDTADLLNKVGYDKLHSNDTVNIPRAMFDATKACTVISSSADTIFRQHAIKAAVADQQAYQDIQNDYDHTRSNIISVVGLDGVSKQGIRDEFDEFRKRNDLLLSAATSFAKTLKTEDEIKAHNSNVRAAMNKMEDVVNKIDTISKRLDAANTPAKKEQYRKQLNELDNEFKKMPHLTPYDDKDRAYEKEMKAKYSSKLETQCSVLSSNTHGKAAANYNKLCKLDGERRAAFDKAYSSSQDAQGLSATAHIEISGPVLTQLKSIAKHLEDKRRRFHSDSKEFKALKNALNSIVETGDFDAFYIPEAQMQELKKAAEDYITAKGEMGSKPTDMRFTRLTAAQELKDLSTMFLNASQVTKNDEVAVNRFLSSNESDRLDKKQQLEAYDPECTFEKEMNGKVQSYQNEVSQKVEKINELYKRVSKDAVIEAPQKTSPQKSVV